MLAVEGLDVFYGDAQALDGVELAVEEGAIVAIVGANGAGKTTLIRAIAGMLRPARGRISVSRQPTSPAGRATASAISASARSPRAGSCFPSLTVAENLEMGAIVPRARAAARRQLRPRACAVSDSGGARAPAGRHAFGRRAADARDRALPDGRARPRDVRRAVARARADDRARACSRRSASSTTRG